MYCFYFPECRVPYGTLFSGLGEVAVALVGTVIRVRRGGLHVTAVGGRLHLAAL